MKKLILPFFCSLFSLNTFSQTVQSANVYPSNLEENMYFEKYDDKTKKISGVTFMILADGDDSKKVTPAFKVKLYIMPEGKTSEKDLTVVKTYDLPGLYQMGSKEYKDEVIDLSAVSVPAGKYRLGIWVNADKSFTEDPSDNATLFKGVISFSPSAATTPSNNDAEPPAEENNDNNDGTEGKGEMKDESKEMSKNNKTNNENTQVNYSLNDLNKLAETKKEEGKKETTTGTEKKEVVSHNTNNEVKKASTTNTTTTTHKVVTQKAPVKSKAPVSKGKTTTTKKK